MFYRCVFFIYACVFLLICLKHITFFSLWKTFVNKHPYPNQTNNHTLKNYRLKTTAKLYMIPLSNLHNKLLIV